MYTDWNILTVRSDDEGTSIVYRKPGSYEGVEDWANEVHTFTPNYVGAALRALANGRDQLPFDRKESLAVVDARHVQVYIGGGTAATGPTRFMVVADALYAELLDLTANEVARLWFEHQVAIRNERYATSDYEKAVGAKRGGTFRSLAEFRSAGELMAETYDKNMAARADARAAEEAYKAELTDLERLLPLESTWELPVVVTGTRCVLRLTTNNSWHFYQVSVREQEAEAETGKEAVAA